MTINKLTHEDVLRILPNRPADSHKGDYGKVLLLCGSQGYTGAAALAAMGALRSGAGLVYLGVPESIYNIEAIKLTEPVVIPLPDKDGMLSENAIDQIKLRMDKMDAILIGCGLGCSEDTYCVVKYILTNFDGPVVLDADGINAISGHIDILRGRTGLTIVTPHEGEFIRLGGVLTGDRVHDACLLARQLHTTIVLKGHETVITDGENVYINPTGNPGMAVGGSGDMLAGMIVSLLGQHIEDLSAAACAVWLHGAAGDLCAAEIGQYGMLPSDMLQILPRLMK